MPALMVAAAGGHLEELWQIRPRLMPLEDDVVWVTTDTPQSRSLLAGEQRLFAPPARPRDAAATVANLRFARHVLALARWSDVVSTGPLMAVPFLGLARARGIRCHFIESPARVAGPSLSARILERIPGVHFYSPYESWRRPAWVYRGSVLDSYRPSDPGRPRLRRVVVTVGTSGYEFGRLVRRLGRVLPKGCEVLWQTGPAEAPAGASGARPFVTAGELASAMANADLVVAHAGVGSALAAMRAGRAPFLVPRRARYGEHVDDHQVQIAGELTGRGLATTCDADDLEPARLWKAAARRVRIEPAPPPFQLDGDPCPPVETFSPRPALAGLRATA